MDSLPIHGSQEQWGGRKTSEEPMKTDCRIGAGVVESKNLCEAIPAPVESLRCIPPLTFKVFVS